MPGSEQCCLRSFSLSDPRIECLTMLTLPNTLTLSRILALPFLVFLLWWPNWELGYLLAFVLYTLMGITDYFDRSEEHTSELQSLMRISYAVFCLKKNKIQYSS